MGLEGSPQSLHGDAIGARVAAILDAANREAATVAAEADADARARLSAAHDEAHDAFRAATDAAREVASERARTLAALRRSIAERSESLILEADDPQHVREQVEALLVAMAEAEATLVAGGAAVREPRVPEALQGTADRGPQTAEAPAEPEPEPVVREPEPIRDVEPEPEPSRAPEADPDGPAVRGLRSAVSDPAQEPAPSRSPFNRWQLHRRDGQVLALLRMAVAGVTREQMEDELEPTLPPAEREALLDDVFGAPEKAGQRADNGSSRGVHAASNTL